MQQTHDPGGILVGSRENGTNQRFLPLCPQNRSKTIRTQKIPISSRLVCPGERRNRNVVPSTTSEAIRGSTRPCNAITGLEPQISMYSILEESRFLGSLCRTCVLPISVVHLAQVLVRYVSHDCLPR
jgi:hypothetical protein